MKEKTLLIFGLAQFLVVIGVYIMLLLNNLIGQLILGFGIILIIYCCLFKSIKLKSDEMFKKIDGASSYFSFIITAVITIILSVSLVYYPKFISVRELLLIIFTTLILSKIVYQTHWYFSTMKNK